MPLHLAPRFHAFVHGMVRTSDEKLARRRYQKVTALFDRHGLREEAGRIAFVRDIAARVLDRFHVDRAHPQYEAVLEFTFIVCAYDDLFVLPDLDWSERHTVAEYWDYQDKLKRQEQLLADVAETTAALVDVLGRCLHLLYDDVPALLHTPDERDEIALRTDVSRAVPNVAALVESMLHVIHDDDYAAMGIFDHLHGRLHRNLIIASGGNPDDPNRFSRPFKTPKKSDITDPEALVETYLGGTPLTALFDQAVAITLPSSTRFEHHHIVAGSGHGKTQTLQYLIASDLPAVAEGARSVVVLDSQGDLIRNVGGLACFAPGGTLHDRLVLIDPTDVEWPVSLNLFDVGMDRLSGYAPLERERLTNSILELYDFVLGTLLSAEMTQKQSVIFRYVTRLMLHIPDATIHTLRELMEPGSQVRFADHIAKLSGSARHFFATEFASREFEQTKKQVLRRLWGILENQTFERMFSHPRSKLDLFHELNTGKVILINTAKDLLKENGTEIFGRFFIAMLAQAAQERATLPEGKRMPTFVYIDEAADYFDRNIGIILAQARKYNLGMVLAHQYLGQLEPKLQEAFSANTSIKFAGGVSAKDARTLAPMLYCEPYLIERQPKGSFAAYVRGVTKAALPVSFPFGFLERQPMMSPAERAEVRRTMRERYAVHYSELHIGGAAEDADEPSRTEPKKETDSDTPTDASPSW